ncbi:MAG: hypothetical protein HKP58_20760 [Desulfatitalea sp.]|nr:hypothetical protein [Desulfatitalea sp.]NNK02849.1 hypothetical protein [Desulfatitalea sp.]
MRLIINKPIMILILIQALACNFAEEAMASHVMEKVRDSYEQLVKVLNGNGAEGFGAFLPKWDEYLITVTTYSNKDHLDAIAELQKNYFDAIEEIERCMIGNGRYARNNYSPVWVEDIKAQFGKKYIKNNRDAILLNFKVIISSLDDYYCHDYIEGVFYKEARLFGAYNYYFKAFLDFYNGGDPEFKRDLQSHKEKVDSFLSLIGGSSMANILFGRGKPSKVLAEIEAKRQDEKLYMFFKAHALSQSFDPQKASQDLDKAMCVP